MTDVFHLGALTGMRPGELFHVRVGSVDLRSRKLLVEGMRGLHSTLAMEAGVTGAVVAASLGHEDESTTKRSYAKAEAVAGAHQRRALTVLSGGAA